MATKLGASLRAARIARGMSLRDLEQQTGISTSYLSSIESGTRKDPTFRTMTKLARALRISLDELAGLKNAKPVSLDYGPHAVAEVQKARDEAGKLQRRLDKVAAVLDATERNASGLK